MVTDARVSVRSEDLPWHDSIARRCLQSPAASTVSPHHHTDLTSHHTTSAHLQINTKPKWNGWNLPNTTLKFIFLNEIFVSGFRFCWSYLQRKHLCFDQNLTIGLINLIHKSHNAPVPYPTMLHSEQKCAHFCSEWNIVGCGTGAVWDLWNWSFWKLITGLVNGLVSV